MCIRDSINTTYESKGSFINLTGTLQEFNNEMMHPHDYWSNEKLLSDLINISGATLPSFEDFIKQLIPFIQESINNPNYINELPLEITETLALNALNEFNMYNLDPILRRSKPLQSTKESLGDN